MHKSEGKCDSPQYTFNTRSEAEQAAQALGLEGSHSHQGQDGKTVYMPGKTHEEFMEATEQNDGHGMDKKNKSKYLMARDAMYKKLMADKKHKRMDPGDHKKAKDGYHKKDRKPYADDVKSDEGVVGRSFDEVL